MHICRPSRTGPAHVRRATRTVTSLLWSVHRIKVSPDIRGGTWRRSRWHGKESQLVRFASKSRTPSAMAGAALNYCTITWPKMISSPGRGIQAPGAIRSPARRRDWANWCAPGSTVGQPVLKFSRPCQVCLPTTAFRRCQGPPRFHSGQRLKKIAARIFRCPAPEMHRAARGGLAKACACRCVMWPAHGKLHKSANDGTTEAKSFPGLLPP